MNKHRRKKLDEQEEILKFVRGLALVFMLMITIGFMGYGVFMVSGNLLASFFLVVIVTLFWVVPHDDKKKR